MKVLGNIWVLFFLFLLLGFVSSKEHSCYAGDFRALMGFMNGLNTRINGWGNVSDCCRWPGVYCESSRVFMLNLSGRGLKGEGLKSLVDLNQLRILNLSLNSFEGSLPPQLFRLQRIEVLDLSFNQFSGSIPPNIDLPLIQNFNLSSNLLTGDLPDALFKSSLLKILYLRNNQISGSLNQKMGNLSLLLSLDISLNRFSGNIPEIFDNLANLQHFSAHSNQFSGPFPKTFSNVSSIHFIDLRNNSLSGTINIDCRKMLNLFSLDLGSNMFHGEIPDDISFCRALRFLNLARNKLNGQIPRGFENLKSLTYLSISNNSFTNISSALKILQNCKNLSTLVLTKNFHKEALPMKDIQEFKNLRALVIANCALTGGVPPWLIVSNKLRLLDLSWNQLDGSIPSWLNSFQSLFYLDLSNNSFTGQIPRSLTQLPSLVSDHNSLEEDVPNSPFYLKKTQNSSGLQYNKIIGFPPTIDLSYNKLTGTITPDFGYLKKLHVLDLSANNLSGEIPPELSGMTSLENLELSRNNLSGSIPRSLATLSFLSRFNVAYNNLSGNIPTDGQFSTFSISCFEGNPNLCIFRPSFCSSSTSVLKESNSGRNRALTVGISTGTGLLVAGFLFALVFFCVSRTHIRSTDKIFRDLESSSSKPTENLGSEIVLLFRNQNNPELSVDDLLKSTDNFNQENIIGCGGFGLVYKASLPDGTKVAIKRLTSDCGQMEREFQAEVQALSRAQHENLVLLQGYCKYGNDRLLIYSFMENGSLDYWLHEKINGEKALDWKIRFNIARGTARGLAYLHQSCQPHILHRDIKSSNILLDHNFRAHLADFGLARLISSYDTHVTTDLVGTLGYIPPEYGISAVATFKGDVYSYGVVLLELLTGKRPVDVCKFREFRDLISWVMKMKKEKREQEVFDPLLYNKTHEKQLLFVLDIACRCLSESPKDRPSIQEIVSWLDGEDANWENKESSKFIFINETCERRDT